MIRAVTNFCANGDEIRIVESAGSALGHRHLAIIDRSPL
jgi:hypothetical protein